MSSFAKCLVGQTHLVYLRVPEIFSINSECYFVILFLETDTNHHRNFHLMELRFTYPSNVLLFCIVQGS